MGKPKLGDKHICLNCEARFFDLGKNPAVCPKCGTEAVAEKPKKKRSQKAKAEEAAAAAAALAEEEAATKASAAEEDDEDDDDDEDEGLMEDASDITGDADDDLDEVLEHVKNED